MDRIEVEGIESYMDRLVQQEVNIHSPMSIQEVQPYGRVKLFSIISPEGVWHEFFETIK